MILWVISYVISNFGLRIALRYNDLTIVQPLSALWFAHLCIALFYLFPLLLAVVHFAKKANMKNLKIIASVLLGFLIIWLLAYTIASFIVSQ